MNQNLRTTKIKMTELYLDETDLLLVLDGSNVFKQFYSNEIVGQNIENLTKRIKELEKELAELKKSKEEIEK